MNILCKKSYYLDYWTRPSEKIFIKGKYYKGKYSSSPHSTKDKVISINTNDNRSIWFSLDSSKPNYFHKYFLGEKEIRLNKLKRIHKFSIIFNIVKKVKVCIRNLFM